jgi:hypothetical protein
VFIQVFVILNKLIYPRIRQKQNRTSTPKKMYTNQYE